MNADSVMQGGKSAAGKLVDAGGRLRWYADWWRCRYALMSKGVRWS
jgi:hypothetical protein